METKELMIGDWVCVTKNFTQKYHKIRALSNDEGSVLRGMYVNEYGVKNHSIFSPNDIEPIPLTAEILEKNGFKLNPQGSYSIGCNISIDMLDGHYNANMNTNNPQIPSFLYMVGKYVHELQHALKLCKIKKEIIL